MCMLMFNQVYNGAIIDDDLASVIYKSQPGVAQLQLTVRRT